MSAPFNQPPTDPRLPGSGEPAPPQPTPPQPTSPPRAPRPQPQKSVPLPDKTVRLPDETVQWANETVQQPQYPAQPKQPAQPQRSPAQPHRNPAQPQRSPAQQFESDAGQPQPSAQRPSRNVPVPQRAPRSERKVQRQTGSLERARAREARWNNNRLAVPYPTDGPKVTYGVLWFVLLIGAVLLGSYFDQPSVASVAIAAVAAPVAGLAGLQTGNGWFPNLAATRGWTAAAAYLAAISGFYGPWGVLIGFAIGLIALMLYVALYRGHRRTALQLFDVLVRSSLPVGVAVASLAALGSVGPGAQVSLILLVSAYEVGDFIVGSGSSNAFEGPLAGLVSVGAVSFLLFLVLPAPFDATSMLLFCALAAICCPLGQILASGLLPRGNTWAPALRRLDSYLLVAPLWLLLITQLLD